MRPVLVAAANSNTVAVRWRTVLRSLPDGGCGGSGNRETKSRLFAIVAAAGATATVAFFSSFSATHDEDDDEISWSTRRRSYRALVANIPVTTTSCEKARTKNIMAHPMRSLVGRPLEMKYDVDWRNVLGEGAFGSVHSATLRSTKEKVALKKINRTFTNSSAFEAETEALLRIYDNGGHPNISGLRDMYCDAKNYYMVIDMVSGGEMFDHLVNYGAYSEADAARLMHEVASAMAFLHGIGISHGDLKPENLLLSTSKRLDGSIKVIDFGSAVLSDDLKGGYGGNSIGLSRKRGSKHANSNGTLAYYSPERFKSEGESTPAMDMWAVGVILYIMLTGCHPFDVTGTASDKEIAQNIMTDARPPMDDDYVGHLSESAKDVILKLMEKDPAKRMTASEMLKHPWVQGITARRQKMEESDTKLSRFQELRNKLEAGMFSVLVSQSASSSSKRKKQPGGTRTMESDATGDLLHRAFAVFDAEGKGFVTSDDLAHVAAERTGSSISEKDAKAFVSTHSLSGESETESDGLSLSQFNQLFSGLVQQHFPRGHFIFRQGDKGDTMYFISSGRVEILTRDGKLICVLRAGEFFGEGSLLDGRPRSASARCATPTDLIEIKRENFQQYVGASKSAKADLKSEWNLRKIDNAKNFLRLQTNVKTRDLKHGDIVFNEGDSGASMYTIPENGGKFEVLQKGKVVDELTNGDSFGESSLIFHRPRS